VLHKTDYFIHCKDAHKMTHNFPYDFSLLRKWNTANKETFLTDILSNLSISLFDHKAIASIISQYAEREPIIIHITTSPTDELLEALVEDDGDYYHDYSQKVEKELINRLGRCTYTNEDMIIPFGLSNGDIIVDYNFTDEEDMNKLIYYDGAVHNLYRHIHEFGTVPPVICLPEYDMDFAEKRELFNLTQWLDIRDICDTLIKRLKWLTFKNLGVKCLFTHINIPHSTKSLNLTFDYYNVDCLAVCRELSATNGFVSSETAAWLVKRCIAFLRAVDIVSLEKPSRCENTILPHQLDEKIYVMTHGVKRDKWDDLTVV